MCMWFNIGLSLLGWCIKMHLCVDFFVTDSPTHSRGNVWRRSDFSLNLLTVHQRTENADKTRLSRNVVFSLFYMWMTGLVTHRQKKVQAMCNVLKNFADARILPFYMELNPSIVKFGILLYYFHAILKTRYILFWLLCGKLYHIMRFMIVSLRGIISPSTYYC